MATLSLILKDVHGDTVALSSVVAGLVQRGIAESAEWMTTDPRAVQVYFSSAANQSLAQANIPPNVLIVNG